MIHASYSKLSKELKHGIEILLDQVMDQNSQKCCLDQLRKNRLAYLNLMIF